MVRALDGSFPETFLSPAGSCDISPTAAADAAGDLHVAWSEGTTDGSRVCWTRGGAGGFSTPVEVSSGEFCRAPRLARAGDELFLLWQEDDDPSRIVLRSWNGDGWDPETELYSSASDPAFAPTAGLSPTGAPFVAWQIGAGIDAQIWQSTRTASGWSAPALLVDPAGPAWLPALADGIVAWSGTGGGTDWNIFASLDGGVGIGEGGSAAMPLEPTLASNPVMQTLSLIVPEDLPGSPEATVRVYDLSGRSLLEVRGILRGGTAVEIPCGGLPRGVYCVRMETDGAAGSWSSLFTVLR